jgi:hypothetical protein
MQDEIKTCISAGIWWHDLSGATNFSNIPNRANNNNFLNEKSS